MSIKQRLSGQAPPCPRIWRRTALALCLPFLCAGSATSISPAMAQSEPAPSIEIAADIRVAPAVLTPLRIRVSRGGALSQQAMLLVHGLPPRVTLSEGRSFGSGVWTVPLANLSKLEIAPATGTGGKTDLTFELVTLDGKLLAQAKSTLHIAPPIAGSRKAPQDAAPNDAIALTAGPLAGGKPLAEPARETPASLGETGSQFPSEQVARARKLVERGDEYMEAGKVASARLLYQSATESGWAAAALALAATYDSSELARWKVIGGIQPDAALARKWYEKAKQLGSPEADRHLQRLSTR